MTHSGSLLSTSCDTDPRNDYESCIDSCRCKQSIRCILLLHITREGVIVACNIGRPVIPIANILVIGFYQRAENEEEKATERRRQAAKDATHAGAAHRAGPSVLRRLSVVGAGLTKNAGVPLRKGCSDTSGVVWEGLPPS